MYNNMRNTPLWKGVLTYNNKNSNTRHAVSGTFDSNTNYPDILVFYPNNTINSFFVIDKPLKTTSVFKALPSNAPGNSLPEEVREVNLVGYYFTTRSSDNL